jgi:proteasome lid subunit RPN8/RPN11
MVADRALLDELIDHARAEYDDECCGLIAYAQGENGATRAVASRRATNVFASPKRFEIDGRELLHTLDEFESEGWDLGAIYHSHTHTEPYPSQTDINFAANWPGLEWVIVGLGSGEPVVRSFFIEDGEVRESPVVIR